jgi:hypothetical protein
MMLRRLPGVLILGFGLAALLALVAGAQPQTGQHAWKTFAGETYNVYRCPASLDCSVRANWTLVVGALTPAQVPVTITYGTIRENYSVEACRNAGTKDEKCLWRGALGWYHEPALEATPPPTPPVGLVAAYNFNEASGTIALDKSGNALHGTLNASVARSTAGKFGGALVFNGSNSRVDVPTDPALDLAANLTMEAWVFPTAALSNWSTILFREQTNELVYALYAGTPTSRPRGFINIGTSEATERSVAGSASLPLNVWTHVAVTYDGATLRLYVNGVTPAGGSVPTTGPMPAGGALRIGGNTIWGEYFVGRIDEVRVYSRALTQPEIQSDMTTPIP